MKKFLVTFVTVLLGGAIVAGAGVFNAVAQEEPPVLVANVVGTKIAPSGEEMPHAVLYLDVYPNSSSKVPQPNTSSPIDNILLAGQPFYSPSTNLQVPANSLVTIHFRQYDGGGQIYNPYFSQVLGTVDGTMKWNGNDVTEIKPGEIGHTFTVHQYPDSNQPYFFMSIPLPMNKANAKTDKAGYPVDPQIVSVTFMTGDPGSYVWNCEFPCGQMYQEFAGPMQTRGWMAGTFDVVEA